MTRTLSLLLTAILLTAPSSMAADTRKPYVAGVFYPERAVDLTAVVDAHLKEAGEPPKVKGRILGAIVPHAGYAFSAGVAAKAYRRLQEEEIETFILIGPYHKSLFEGAAVWTGPFWSSPLGDIEVDVKLAKRIASENPLFRHDAAVHLDEHSLEAQIPFIQRTHPDAKIVPILTNDLSPENTAMLAKVLWKYMREKKIALIASTDMSHYHSEFKAREKDAKTLEKLKSADPNALFSHVTGGGGELCGSAAALVFLEVGRLAGVSSLDLLEYETSAKTGMDALKVVGYSSFLMVQSEEDLARMAPPTSADRLLKLARESVEAFVEDTDLPEIPEDDPSFAQRKAVFVTIRKNDQLRGCIGRMYPEGGLAEMVQRMAVEAATKDTRFSAVRPSELEDLNYEISVLSSPKRAKSADEIVMGTHGVMLRQGPKGGTFLPSVAAEFDNDKEAFLSELCVQKVGLTSSCWKDPKTDIYLFTTEEIKETA